MRAASFAVMLVCLVLAPPACDSATDVPDSGIEVVDRDQGIDFGNGRVVSPGSYATTDLLASDDGDSGMSLATGGKTPIDNRPITWFKTGGGIAPAFPDLASVPRQPLPTAYDAMLHAKQGFGFMLQTKHGDFVRGWLASASPTSVTIQWERVFPESE